MFEGHINIPVSEIDDRIMAPIFLFYFYAIGDFILALHLRLWILNRKFLGSNIV
jgi:hypothetical protein